MKVVDYVKGLKPHEIAEELRKLYNAKSEYEYLRNVYGDYDGTLKSYKTLAEESWAKARLCESFTHGDVGFFVAAVNRYKEILNSDREEKLMEADVKEKAVNYRYDGLIDKKYWAGEHLLYVSEYLEDGKAKTVEQAVGLYEKDGGRY